MGRLTQRAGDGIFVSTVYHLRSVRPDRGAQAGSCAFAPDGRLYAGFLSRMAPFWRGLQTGQGILTLTALAPFLRQVRDLISLRLALDCRMATSVIPGSSAACVAVGSPSRSCGKAAFGGRVAAFHQLEKPLQEPGWESMTKNCEAAPFRAASEHLLVWRRRVRLGHLPHDPAVAAIDVVAEGDLAVGMAVTVL